MSKTIALYCRTANANPDEMARQRYALHLYARQNGVTLDDVTFYEDDGYSAHDPKRPAFMQLELDVMDGKVARVVTTSLTRLGRNTAEVVRWAIWLRRHSVEIFTLDDRAELNTLLAGLEGGAADE